jgi:hypothetical protein
LDRTITETDDPRRNRLQEVDRMKDRWLGVAALIVAAAIPMFIVVFGIAARGGLPAAAQSDPRIAATFFHGQPGYMVALMANSLVMHLAVIALAVGLYPRLAAVSPWVATIGTALGIAWAVLDIAQSSIGYATMVGSSAADAVTVDAIARAIQNAAHLNGGLWVLSIAAAGSASFGRVHRTVAFVVGTVFALHVLIVPLNPAWWSLEYVGLPIFFAWTGIALLRTGREPRQLRAAATAGAG